MLPWEDHQKDEQSHHRVDFLEECETSVNHRRTNRSTIQFQMINSDIIFQHVTQYPSTIDADEVLGKIDVDNGGVVSKNKR